MKLGNPTLARSETAARRKLVLLVEESVETLRRHGSSLRLDGYYVVEADSVHSASEAVRALCPDVVVLDSRLPDGDGLALLETWRASRTAMADVPVLVLAAPAQGYEGDAARFAGADDLVPKTCPDDVLALHVTRALEGSAQRSRAP